MDGCISVNVTDANYVQYAASLRSLLGNNFFNMGTESGGLFLNKQSKVLKYCNRRIGTVAKATGGQVSIELLPGGSIAWDLNVERVVIHFEKNGDILIERLFDKGKWKRVLCTKNPI